MKGMAFNQAGKLAATGLRPTERVLESAGEAILLALMGATPLAMAFPLNDAFDLPKMSLVYAGVLSLTVVWALKCAAARAFQWKTTPLDTPLAALLVAAGVSAAFSWHRPTSLFGQYREYAFGWTAMAAFAGLFWMTVQFAGVSLRAKAGGVLRAAAALAAAYGLAQYFGREVFAQMPSVEGGRVWSTLGNPVYFGGLLMMSAPLFLGAIVSPSASGLSRVANAAGLALAAGGLWASRSRSAWIGTLAGAAVFLAWALAQKQLSRRAARLALVLGAALAAALLTQSVRGRLLSVFSREDASNQARWSGWVGAARMAMDHPFVGTGPDTFALAFRGYKDATYTRAATGRVTQGHAHNDPLQWASTTGLAGLGAYFWLLVTAVTLAWRHLRLRAAGVLDAAAVAALAALFTQNLFNFSSVSTSAVAALLAGLWVWNARREEANSERPVASPAFWAAASVSAAAAAGAALAVLVINPLRADALVRRGEALALKGRHDAAVKSYERAVALAPRVDEYHARLAGVYKAWADRSPADVRPALLKNALAAAERRRDLQPRNPDAHDALGVARMWLTAQGAEDMTAAAEQDFRKALDLDRTCVEAWSNYAKLLHRKGELEAEKQIWRRVLTMDPSDETARRLLDRLEAGATEDR